MASLVMRQLEMTREVTERQRAMKMGQALSNFVDGKLPIIRPHFQTQDGSLPFLHPSSASNETTQTSPEREASEAATKVSGDRDARPEPIEDSRLSNFTRESSLDTQETLSDSVNGSFSEESDPEENIDLTFARAAYLIREGLDVQGW
jgi:hypothetical protein